MEFLWAAMALFEDATPGGPDTADAYRPPWLDIHSIPYARTRVERRLVGGEKHNALLGALLPPSEPDNPVRSELRARMRRRSAWGSAFAARLELVKHGAVVLNQEEAFGPIQVRRVGGWAAAKAGGGTG